MARHRLRENPDRYIRPICFGRALGVEKRHRIEPGADNPIRGDACITQNLLGDMGGDLKGTVSDAHLITDQDIQYRLVGVSPVQTSRRNTSRIPATESFGSHWPPPGDGCEHRRCSPITQEEQEKADSLLRFF